MANARDVAALCAMIITKHDPATGSSDRTSLQLTRGSPIDGNPPAIGPTTATPRSARCNTLLAAIVSTTATNDRGQRGAKRLPSKIAVARKPEAAREGYTA